VGDILVEGVIVEKVSWACPGRMISCSPTEISLVAAKPSPDVGKCLTVMLWTAPPQFWIHCDKER